MIFVEGGSFEMGSEENDEEMPIHKVNVKPFWIGKYPITFEEYMIYCKSTGSPKPEGWGILGKFKHPVVNVSWEEAQSFCSWLSKQTGRNFRLPTEAEWEFAAKGGKLSKGFLYSGSNDLDEVGWCNDNSDDEAQQVGRKKSNELGIHDMSGNVWEWVEDNCHDDYAGAPTDGSAWRTFPGDIGVILRGGAFYISESNCTNTYRFDGPANKAYDFSGFRIACSM